MRLLVIRHAEAEDKEAFAATGQDDAMRPLTERGRRRMNEGARGLRTLVTSIDLLAASPLVRAQQTAEIVAHRYGDCAVETTETLEPGTAPSRFLSWLREQDGSVIAIVGHEPDLGTLVTWLLTGATESHVPLGKGAACLLDLGETPGKAKATLEWAITASQLRRLAD